MLLLYFLCEVFLMATKYHNSPNGPRVCTARIKECLYAEAGQAHYPSYELAQAAYEKTLETQYGVVPTMGIADRVANKTYKKYGETLEKIDDTSRKIIRQYIHAKNFINSKVKTIKASPAIQVANKAHNVIVRSARAAFEEAQDELGLDKNRMIAHYRVRRVHAKNIIRRNSDKFKKVTDFTQEVSQAMSEEKKYLLEEAKHLRNIVKQAPKQAQSHVKNFINTKKDSFQEMTDYHKNNLRVIRMKAKKSIPQKSSYMAKHLSNKNSLQKSLNVMNLAKSHRKSIHRLDERFSSRTRKVENPNQALLHTLKNSPSSNFNKLVPLKLALNNIPQNVNSKDYQAMNEYFTLLGKSNTHRADYVAEFRKPGEGRRKKVLNNA